jgi:hypothetical protein
VNDISVTEGNSGTTAATFIVTRAGTISGTSTVKVKTLNVTATAPSDYAAVPLTTVTFSPGQTTRAVTVNVVADKVFEANETFKLSLSGASGATIADNTGLATIVNDDAKPQLSVSDVSLNEGDSGPTPATFTLNRSGNPSGVVTVKVKTLNGTATTTNNDYTALPSTLVSFADGQTTQTVTVNVIGDVSFEKNETFSLVLSTPVGAAISDGTGVATIVNDDAAPLLSVNDVSVTEGNSGTTPATFTITRSGNTAAAVSVKVKTTNGTAVSTSDYVAVPLTVVNFAAGQTTATVDVMVNGDTLHEANETFTLVLSAPTGATLVDASGKATIVNDD